MLNVGELVEIVTNDTFFSYSRFNGRKCRIKSRDPAGYTVDIPLILGDGFRWVRKQHLKAVNQQLTFIFKE